MKTQLWVKWLTADKSAIARIRERFGIPDYTTLNGLSPVEIDDADLPTLRETARRGFIAAINANWSKNGEVFTFISR